MVKFYSLGQFPGDHFSLEVESSFELVLTKLLLQAVQLYISTETATACKNSRFILSERSNFQIVVKLSIPSLSLC